MAQPKEEDIGLKVKLVANRCQSDLNKLILLNTIDQGYGNIVNTHRTGQIMPVLLYEKQSAVGKALKTEKSSEMSNITL